MGEPIVKVKQGKLRGKLTENIRGGEKYYSFTGIPYAKPPIGNLRFKDPQPSGPWDGVLDVTEDRSNCYARDMLTRTISGTEDCLFLNVYTPQLPAQGVKPKPVMFWIHGGGFIFGSGQKALYGPDYLIKEDVVIVSFNYRLGILGFANFKDPSLEVPGNAGLKDILLALKWVNENISNFNGDPKNITIFGESAGAASAHYLILSPKAKNLFHKAILQSGCAINEWTRGQPTAKIFAEALGMDDWDEKKVLNVLRSLPIEKLYEVQERIKEEFIFSKMRALGPTIEDPSNKNAFLTEEPLNLMKTGNYTKVPMIMGYTSREGIFWSLNHVLDGQEFQPPSNLEEMIPFLYNIPLGSEKSKQMAKEMERLYYGNEARSLDGTYQLYSDVGFYRGVHDVLTQHVKVSDTPTYFYRFSLDRKTSFLKKILNIDKPGASHGDELGYLFYIPFCPPPTNEYSYENLTIKRLCKLWTTFARTGNPNFKGEEDVYAVEWKPVEKGKLHYLELGENVTVGVNPDGTRMGVWDRMLGVSKK